MRNSPAEQSPSGTPQPGGSGTQSGGGGTNGKAEMWQPDEAAVRDGTCSFNVKVNLTYFPIELNFNAHKLYRSSSPPPPPAPSPEPYPLPSVSYQFLLITF